MNYADSGFVVSLYLTTEGTSAQPRKEVKRTSKPILLSPLSLLEIRNSLNFGIHRGEITGEQRDAVLSEIDAQIETGLFRMVYASQSSIYAKAHELSNKHTPKVASRSLDLVHLAAALLCEVRTFLTFDKRQTKAASRRGIGGEALIAVLAQDKAPAETRFIRCTRTKRTSFCDKPNRFACKEWGGWIFV